MRSSTHVVLGTSALLASSTAVYLARSSSLVPATFLPLSSTTWNSFDASRGFWFNSVFTPFRSFATASNNPRRSFFSSSTTMGSDANKSAGQQFPKGKSEAEWRTVLSPAQFKVLREQGTEPGFTHEYGELSKEGVYRCAGCDTPLYKSATKFKSGCGWPAFFDAIPGAVTRKVDKSWGMKRIEIRCAACDGHLGHVFEGEGFSTPTDERHCVNGISLRFNEGEKLEGKA